MEFCICSICNQLSPKNTSLVVYFENNLEYYMCESCTNSSVKTPFCSECLSTENLVYMDGNVGVYGCEKHYVELLQIFG